jgi:hypothetical protein
VVDDVVCAADLARFVVAGGAVHLAGVVQRSRSGVGAQDAGATDAGHEPLAVGKQRLDLVAGDMHVVGVRHGDVGRTQDADGVDRHQNVPVAGGRQAVHHRRRQSTVEDEHRALARAHGEPRAGESRHLAGPRTGGRHDGPAGDRPLLAGARISDADCGHGAGGRALEPDHLVVAQRGSPMLPGASQVGIDELPRLERGVGDAVCGADLAREKRLGSEQRIERDRLRLDTGRGAGGRKAVEVVVGVVGCRDEVAAGRLDGGRRDPAQHGVLLGAVARGDRVGLDVSGA